MRFRRTSCLWCAIALALMLTPFTANADGLIPIGGSHNFGAESVQYHGTNTGAAQESRFAYPIPRDGFLVSLAINLDNNLYDSSTEFMVRVSGVDTALSVSIPAFSTDNISLVHPGVPVAQGDLVILETDITGSTSGTIDFVVMLEYENDPSKSALPASARWSALILGILLLIFAFRSLLSQRLRLL